MKTLERKIGFDTRRVAVELLAQILRDKHSLDYLLDRGLDCGFALLPQRDRKLAYSIVVTALRHKGEIDAVITSALAKGLPKRAGTLEAVLQSALAQILFMDIADHAAVSLAVDVAATHRKTRPYKPLINGVLRSVVRNKETYKPDATLNTPTWLKDIWYNDYGAERATSIMLANARQAPLDLTVKSDPEYWAKCLGGDVLPGGTVRLNGAKSIEELDGYQEGAWWVQDAAASVPARMLLNALSKGSEEPMKILDLCAAPGGKTAQLALSGAHVTALDISGKRLMRLKENLSRLRLTVKSLQADLFDFSPPQAYDGILLDAPCSATGTVRRHPDVLWLKSTDMLNELQNLQHRMLARTIGMLKPSGVLVYCTCSLQKSEGEEHIQAALKNLPVTFLPITMEEVAIGTPLSVKDGIFRSTPEIAPGMDGFFAARLKRL